MSRQEASGKDGMSTKEALLWTAAGLAAASGLTLLTIKLIHGVQAGNEQNKSLEDGPALYAKQIKMAFENDGWPGTDEEALRQVMRSIPSKEVFDKVVTSYRKMYRNNLLEDMASELQSSEYKEMLNILAGKPQKLRSGETPAPNYRAWAERLKAAFDISYGPFPGTDEEAIRAVFTEIPTKAAFKNVEQQYKQLYSKELMNDLQSELEFWEYPQYQAMIDRKP